MRPHELPIALLAFIAFVVFAPAWMYYLGEFPIEHAEHGLIAMTVPGAALLLYITSWVHPDLAGKALGALLIAMVIVLVPWWWELVGMVSGAFVQNPFAQTLVQLALPAIILTYVAGLGYKKIQEMAQ